jgi:hypothetical protein
VLDVPEAFITARLRIAAANNEDGEEPHTSRYAGFRKPPPEGRCGFGTGWPPSRGRTGRDGSDRGAYRKPAYHVPQDDDFASCRCRTPKRTKNVPGRKTDVEDAE